MKASWRCSVPATASASPPGRRRNQVGRARRSRPVLERGGKARLTLFHLRWGWEHQWIAKLDDLLDVVGVDDFERHQSAGRILDVDVARLGNQMIQSFERDLDDVVVGIISNAEQRQPLRFDLIAKPERGDLDFGFLAFE